MKRMVQKAVLAAAVTTCVAPLATAQSTSWVKGGESGRLVYGMDASGDRVNDFSRAGYMGGNVPLPMAATLGVPVITVSPAAGDSLATIQAALDQAGARPLQATGYRAIVQLSGGTFRVSDSLRMSNSGVILRGTGAGTTGSVLSYTGTSGSLDNPEQMIIVGNSAARAVTPNTQRNVTAKFVPAGSYALPLNSIAGYNVGDKILVERPSPIEWLEDIGMRDLDNPWGPGNYNQNYERVITAIDTKNNSVMLDTPIPNALQAKYGGAKVSKYSFNRITNVGIESIRGDGQAVLGASDAENHAWTFVQVNSAENVFVRDVAGVHLAYATVEAGGNSKHVTVNNATFSEAQSEITGGRRYSFNQEGQYGLMENVRSTGGRHDFVNNSPSRGPNVFLDATATSSRDDSGPHQRWSTGSLFDNVSHSGGNGIRIRNRGNSGSGHGWTGSGFVLWNSASTSGLIVQSPPTSQNWAIGNSGTNETTSQSAYFASAGTPVTLGVNGQSYDSLYRAQLADRLSRTGETIREYTVGDYDGLESGDTADAPYVDPVWLEAAIARKRDVPIRGFDDRTPKANIPFTFLFDLDPTSEHVSSAVLTLSLDPTATSSGAGTQVFADTTAMSANYVNDFGDKPGFTTETGVSIDVLTIEFTNGGYFDLAKLQDGQLNVLVFDNHAIDWANLVITVAPGAVPEPATFGFLSLAAIPFLLRHRRRPENA